jgi:hypothetical protein
MAIQGKNLGSLLKKNKAYFAVVLFIVLYVFLLYFPLLSNFSSKIAVPSLDNQDGGYGDGPFTIHTIWRLQNTNYFDSLNPLNSYPFGEPGYTPAFVSQVMFWGPLYLLSKVMNPIAAFNSFVLLHIFLTGFLSWFLAKKFSGDVIISFLAIPLIISWPFTLNLIGGPSALIQQSTILFQVLLCYNLIQNPKRITPLLVVLNWSVSLYSDIFIFLINSLVFFISVLTVFFTSRKKLGRFLPEIGRFAITFGLFFIVNIFFVLKAFQATIEGSSPSTFVRPYQEWIGFGAQWWMFLTPSPDYFPVLGQFHERVKTNLAGEVSSSARLSAQLVSPTFVQVSLVCILLMITLIVKLNQKKTLTKRNKKVSSNSRNKKLDLISLYLGLIIVCTILLSLVPTNFDSARFFFPSFYLFQVSPVWRYTGRIILLTNIAVSLIIVLYYSRILKRIHKTKLFSILLVLITSLLSILPQHEIRSDLKYVDYERVPLLYSDLAKRDGPYAEFPNLTHFVPFPGAAFQVITNRPTLDDVSLNERSKSLAERINPLCDKESSSILSSLGFREIVVHLDLLKNDRINWKSCGYEVVRMFDSNQAKSLGHPSWKPWERSVILEPITSSMQSFLLPNINHFFVETDIALKSNWKLVTDTGNLEIIRVGKAQRANLTSTILAGNIQGISCKKHSRLPSHDFAISSVTSGSQLKLSIPNWCDEISIVKGQGQDLIMSPPILSVDLKG